VRTCQQVFSAALIAHVETAYADDVAKNRLCTPIPHPDTELDWLRTTVDNGRNERRWRKTKRCRLARGLPAELAAPRRPAAPDRALARAAVERYMREASLAVGEKLEALLAAYAAGPPASLNQETVHG